MRFYLLGREMPVIKLFTLVLATGLFVARLAIGAEDVAGQTSGQTSGQDEDSIVFMGKCPNGAMYRLRAYDTYEAGMVKSFYDYEGPAGKGTIQSKTPPKVLAIRVCRALAEIRGDS